MSHKKTLILALALVAGVNLFVLGGIAYNRSGQEASFSLTERELSPQTMDKEDTSLSLTLEINSLEKLPEDKLRELGFNLDRHLKKDWHQLPSRKVYAALEYEGPAWQKWLAENEKSIAKEEKLLEEAQKNHRPKRDMGEISERIDGLVTTQETTSHLFPVGVALDAAALRKAYPNRSRVAIVPALLEVHSYEQDKKWTYNSSLRLMNNDVHVDQAYRILFLGLKDVNKNFWTNRAKYSYGGNGNNWYHTGKNPAEHWHPRYQATLAFGKRFEPWLTDCKTLPVP